MESIELKLREVDNAQFPIVLTKQMVEILHGPEMSIEIRNAHTEEVARLLDSLGYEVAAKKPMDGWTMVKAVPKK